VRVAKLRSLFDGTVLDDGQVDMLTGASGLDWFFVGDGDIVTRIQDSETIS